MRAARHAAGTLVLGLGLVTSVAHADQTNAPTGPKTGFTMEARLVQSISPASVTIAGAAQSAEAPTFGGSNFGGPPPIALGYRGDGFAVLAGPSFGAIASNDTSSGIFVAATVMGELRVVKSDDKRAEGYLLAGATLGADSLTGTDQAQAAYGGFLGFGGRYWLSRHLAIGAELGESYLSVPAGIDSASYSSGDGSTTTTITVNERTSILATWGDLHVAVDF